MQQILIVEDDAALADGLCRALQSETVRTVSCNSLREGRRLLDKQKAGNEFLLVLLDVNLPDGNGFDFLREIKQKYDIRVIILTVNDMETDIVAGLESGADDYITKPFSLAVLRARVAVQLRRDNLSEKEEETRRTEDIVIGDYRFNFVQMKFFHGEEAVELSKTEQKLLRILVENRGITVTRERLFDYIWSQEAEFVDENALSVTVKRLRDKLGGHKMIRTVYGIGYVWAEEA